jgi:hypothetical protein
MTYAQAEKEARQAWAELARHYAAAVGSARAFDELHPAYRHWLVALTWHIRSRGGERP